MRCGPPNAASDEMIFFADAGVGQLEEVVVTARRREERLLDVPIAVSVLSQSTLQQRQIDELAGLQLAVPNLLVTTDQTNRATSLIAMRGQFEPGSVPTLDPAVGIYLDGVYIARITGANLRLLDMERVEVLRGPQGTLFGRNTIGGAISLVTNPPSAVFEGSVEGTIGNYDRREIEGVVNAPFGNGAHAFRLAALHAEHSGFGRSTLLGRDLDDDDTDYLRASLRLNPAEHWELAVSVDSTQFRNGGQLRTLVAATPSASEVTVASGNTDDDIQDYVSPYDRSVPANRAESVRTRVSGAAAVLTFDGPRWTFKSITSFRSLDGLALEGDQDATPYDLAAVLRRDDEQDQFSQEVQLLGNAFDSRLDWIGGFLYFEERAVFDQQFLSFNPASSRWSEQLPYGVARNDSVAAYAQGVYAITPRWRITGGVRFNEDGRQLTSGNARLDAGEEICTLDPALVDAPGTCRATLAKRHFRYTPYTVGVDFRPVERALLYAKASRGYRSGGYNLRGATAIDLGTFGPESVMAYEIGAKADLLDGRLRVDVAAFQSRFEDIQLLQSELVSGQVQPMTFVQNGGEARIEGGELEFTAIAGRLQLSGSLGIVDPRFTRLDSDVVEVTLDSNFLSIPATTVALAADWSQPTPFGSLDWHVDYAWRDDVPFAYDPDSAARQEAYGLWNARVQWRLEQTALDFALWVRNLTDEHYLTRALDSRLFISGSLGDPRSYGISVSYRFGPD